MTKARASLQNNPLHSHIAWLIRLRWFAALAVILGAWIDLRWLGWYERSGAMALLGLGIAAYNVVLAVTLGRLTDRRPSLNSLRIFACIQLLLDLACLSIMVRWTGGVRSPLTPFFVLHMVFASLLLPRILAYACAMLVILIYVGSLWGAGLLPIGRDDRLLIAGRGLALLATVYVANQITRGLRQQRRRLIRQNRRIRTMGRQLKRHQRALAQQEKMVALGQMAAGVTHEIANPLASMDSLLQLMQRKPDRLRPDAISTLREQIGRINQIIDQMKTFAHPADGQQQMVDLNEVVDKSLHMIRFDKRLKDVRVERLLSPTTGSLALLPQALQQVMVNLIINALDAMSQTPEPVLTVRTERREGWCIVEVSDNGTGISHENMGRLFEPFFTTKPIGKGTGLGLSISYSLIQKQGGSITVKSQVGHGTSFMIRLPVSRHETSGKAIATPLNESN